MKLQWPWIVGTLLLIGAVLPTRLAAQTERGPYARIAILRPHDGDTVDFEAGSIRNLEWQEDERDSFLNVTGHAQFVGNALFEYLPGLSRGTGTPEPTARVELTAACAGHSCT